MPPTPKAKEYRYVGNHAVELEIGETRPWVGFGDFIKLKDTDLTDVTKQMIEDGLLVDTSKIEATEDEKGGK